MKKIIFIWLALVSLTSYTQTIEVKSLIFESQANFPTTGVDGELYFSSTTRQLYVYNGLTDQYDQLTGLSVTPSWNNLQDIPAGFADNIDNINDADSDPNNEINVATRTGTTVDLSNGGGSFSIADGDTSRENEGRIGVGAGTATSSTLTTNTLNSNPVTINTGSGLSISESTSINGGSITINNTGDLSNTNEIQTLSRGGNSISLSSGGGSVSLDATNATLLDGLDSTEFLRKSIVNQLSNNLEFQLDNIATTKRFVIRNINDDILFDVQAAGSGNQVIGLYGNNDDIFISNSGISVRAPSGAMKYLADYSSSYTDRSIVDKGYVDGQINNIPSSSTDLSYSSSSVDGTVNSSTGTNATIPLRTEINAGLSPPINNQPELDVTTTVSTNFFGSLIFQVVNGFLLIKMNDFGSKLTSSGETLVSIVYTSMLPNEYRPAFDNNLVTHSVRNSSYEYGFEIFSNGQVTISSNIPTTESNKRLTQILYIPL